VGGRHVMNGYAYNRRYERRNRREEIREKIMNCDGGESALNLNITARIYRQRNKNDGRLLV
jgi:hypothetical protein